jgi:hypothetical protein
MELIAEDDLVCKLHAMRLHRMRWSQVKLSGLWVMEIADPMLHSRARHSDCGVKYQANLDKYLTSTPKTGGFCVQDRI